MTVHAKLKNLAMTRKVAEWVNTMPDAHASDVAESLARVAMPRLFGHDSLCAPVLYSVLPGQWIAEDALTAFLKHCGKKTQCCCHCQSTEPVRTQHRS